MSLVHVPAAAWGIFVELTGRTCPLTFIENGLRIHAGSAGYAESFVEHYLLRIIYPEALTGALQAALAGLILVVNGAIYGWVLHRLRSIGACRNSRPRPHALHPDREAHARAASDCACGSNVRGAAGSRDLRP